MDQVLFSTAANDGGGRDDWQTPKWLLGALAMWAGCPPIVLDPCSNGANAVGPNFYTEEENGLIQPWAKFGKIFVNPPYSGIKQWCKKAHDESLLLQNSDDYIALLIPARTDTQYFHDYVIKATQLFFLKGRLKFELPDGTKGGSAPFPSVIAIWRGESDRHEDCDYVQFVDWRP